MSGRFGGKIALVTGAGGGIGCAVARDLAGEGALVHALDLKPVSGSFEGRKDVTYHRCDLRDGGGVESVMADIRRRHGRLDKVVNAAGVCLFEKDGSVEAADDSVFALTMDVNLHGAIRIIRGSVPLMRSAGGGVFVHVASVVGLRNMENILAAGPADAYQLSKAALVSLSRSIAMQYAHENIRSNTVCPGSVATPMTADIYDAADRVAAMESRTPLRRIARPEDISPAILFLLSDEASFITGVDLPVDGGLLAKL